MRRAAAASACAAAAALVMAGSVLAAKIDGTSGNDTIDARDGAQDLIDCGDGVDTVIVDAQEDGVFNCENVVYPKGG